MHWGGTKSYGDFTAWLLDCCGSWIDTFTKNVIRKSYEKPMHDLADATKKWQRAIFSVYVPTLHTADRLDYLDVMIIDFNKMVEELGSIETLKTDFFSNVSHEIKTPLAIIQNNAELLCMEKDAGETKRICRSDLSDYKASVGTYQ